MQKGKDKSTPVELLDLVWASANRDSGHSWERLNHAMAAGLTLAIGAGFEFSEGDIRYIMQSYRTGRWIGESDEWVYSLAVEVGNVSAARSFEAYKGRPPFIADGVRPRSLGSPWLHGASRRKRGRLAVGFDFPWAGATAWVTSFAEDGSYLTACSYKDDNPSRNRQPLRRFKISREDILAERVKRKGGAQ